MRTCPHCSVPLTEVDYSGFHVLYCSQCRGHLVDVTRLESIKRTVRKPPAELKAEATAEYRAEPQDPISCPKCHLTMAKRPVRLPGLTLHMDCCKACALIWLDGGELALLQLEHRTTASYRDDQELMRRAALLESDPARKEAFERDLARLPDEEDLPLDDVYGHPVQYAWGADVLIELLKRMWR